MINCIKCNKKISYGEKHASIAYSIESMALDGGSLSVNVISSEELTTLCSNCMRLNDEKSTKEYLLSVIKQRDPESN